MPLPAQEWAMPIAMTNRSVATRRSHVMPWMQAAALIEARALTAHAHERQLTSTYSGLRPISGSSDDPIDLVDAVLKLSPICGTCVAAKSDLPAYSVEIALKVLVRVGAIQLEGGPCECCHRPGAFSPWRPAN
jgi:hypothetical protein